MLCGLFSSTCFKGDRCDPAMQRQHRLKNRREFRSVFKYGKSTANRYFVVYTNRKKADEPVRIGVSISKKVAKNAVARNRLKRLIKEIVRHRIAQISPGQDLVIIARKDAVKLDYHQAEQSLLHLLKKARLLTRNSRFHVRG